MYVITFNDFIALFKGSIGLSEFQTNKTKISLLYITKKTKYTANVFINMK